MELLKRSKACTSYNPILGSSFLQQANFILGSSCLPKWRDLCSLKNGCRGSYLVPHAGRALAFFSKKHFVSFFKEAFCWFRSGFSKISHHSLVRHFRWIQSAFSFKTWTGFFNHMFLGRIPTYIPTSCGDLHQSAFLRMLNFRVWSYPQTWKKEHALRGISRLWWDFCGGHAQTFFSWFFRVPVAII